MTNNIATIGPQPFTDKPLSDLVDDVLRHHVNELAQSLGDDDPYIVYMRSTLPTAVILPFPRKGERHAQ